MLVGAQQISLLFEDDSRTEMRMRVIRFLLQHPGEELKGFAEVSLSGTPSALLRGLNLLAGHVQECDGQVDRTGNPARRAAADLTKGLGRVAVLVLLHAADSLEMSCHDRAQLGRGDLVLGGRGRRPLKTWERPRAPRAYGRQLSPANSSRQAVPGDTAWNLVNTLSRSLAQEG